MKRLALTLSVLLFTFSLDVVAAPLITFEERTEKAQSKSDFEALEEFRSQIVGLDCSELRELERALAKKREQATTNFDRKYWGSRSYVVIEEFSDKCN